LKLARCPHSLAPTLVALPSISLIPFARFFLLPSAFLRPSYFLGAAADSWAWKIIFQINDSTKGHRRGLKNKRNKEKPPGH
jgi:hypothetical protein